MDKTSMESAGGTEFGFESHRWKVSFSIGKPTASYKIFHSEEFKSILLTNTNMMFALPACLANPTGIIRIGPEKICHADCAMLAI